MPGRSQQLRRGRWSLVGGPSEMHAVPFTSASPPPDNTRCRAIFIRHEDEIGAMSWNQRLKTRAKNYLGGGKKDDDADLCGELNSSKPVQYRLAATSTLPTRKTLVERFVGFLTCSSKSKAKTHVGVNPNQQLAIYLHWMFRVNFAFLFMVMCLFFFALVILFAGFITIAGKIDPQCVRVGGEEFDAANTAFADAFALSWTTFSTVGYGSVYPGLGFQNSNPTNCFFINFICSLESLFGILYSGFCGAILFGKVLRIQSHAQVIFSDPIVLKYGTGVEEENDDRIKDEETGADHKKKLPCPVLEFRIVNRLYKEVGGEIMDASLNVVANIDADDTDGKALSDDSDSTHEGSISDTASEGLSSRATDNQVHASLHRLIGPILASFSTKENHAIEEDPTSRLVNKHIFSKLAIEANDHPFFKRVWLARHVLDENSPIVRPSVRRQIRRLGGFWPYRFNNYDAIRNSLQFNQILVSLSGVSNVSASVVFAQKIYDWVDVNIGYEFVNILYRDRDGELGVNVELINDVQEQKGGGGEPLSIDE